MAGQAIRLSQIVTTYGPGAILEGPAGPRIIRSLETSGLFDIVQPSEIEIVDQRLSQSLLDGAGILRLPTNAELGFVESSYVYKTTPFPSWSLCVRHGLMYNYGRRGDRVGCPRCGIHSEHEAKQKARREAIRFVMACPKGHLDDVDWRALVRHKQPGCRPSYLIWRGGGGALKNVDIVCPKCGGSFNLGQAYGSDLKCSGRYPELGREREECDAKAKMIQRGAANLYMPEIVTSLTIKGDTRLHQLLGRSEIQLLLLALPTKDKGSLIGCLQPLAESRPYLRKVIEEAQKYPEEFVEEVIRDVCQTLPASTPHEYRVEEFKALQAAAFRGARLVPSATPGAPPMFEVEKNDVRKVLGPRGRSLRVTPVSRLRVVMVQSGYRRLEPVNSFVVPTCYDDGGRKWYMGVETFGEGIFVDLAPDSQGNDVDHFHLDGPESEVWMRAHKAPDGFGLGDGIYSREQIHPIFVWWHTLAHRLINALSIDSGYSAASIRERVFVEIDPSEPSRARGGVLLYTTQQGGDGTLGGLVGLVPTFGRVLDSALRNLDTCSNDPLCGEEKFGPGRLNGAACYACEFVSETSCEHRNMFLDRNLLRENLP